MEKRNTITNQKVTGRGIRNLRWWILPMVTAIIVWVLVAGSLRQPAGPAQGTMFQGKAAVAASSEPTNLRVATYNIHGGRDAHGHESLAGIAGCLRDADLVALNEVRGGIGGRPVNQSRILGERLGLAWLFAPYERRWWQDHFGNGCLTSLPVLFWQRIPLAGPERGRERNAVWVQLDYQGRNLQVVITHLDRGGDRQSQLRAVTKFFLGLAEPCLLLGDLNTGEDDGDLQNLLATSGVRDPVKDCLGKATPPRIDWILSRGMRGVYASVCDDGASDHPCFRVNLEVPSG
ncbi:MAG TPA: hypothetical protein DCZ69_06280 [Syntrophobacteraceae bacterium]|nr:hypothetical protein [Syntrophobacteraceae bacterium]HBZ55113.1 hypothetical protein [Syntrophobacteraceae bacterium]